MITILSPAKTLDFESPIPNVKSTPPAFIEESEQVIAKLRTLSKKKVSSLMNINKDLTELNVMRYQEWSPDFTLDESRPAALTFSGEVYRGLNASEFTQDDLNFSNDHLRILSGLHGVLKPLDRIRPYRLEMGTKLPIRRKKNLYEFWGDKVTASINQSIAESGSDVLINLASSEYFKVIDFSKIKGRVITPVFKDLKGEEYKVVMTWAKHMRGAMARYIIENRINDPEQLKGFEPYHYSEPMSSESEWVFIR